MKLNKEHIELIKIFSIIILISFLLAYAIHLLTIKKYNVYINGELLFQNKKVSIFEGTASFDEIKSSNFTKIGNDLYIIK